MRLHRFYINPEQTELEHAFWFKDEHLRHQWQKVLRLRQGDQVVLFDGVQHERLYRLVRIKPDAIKLELVTEFERKLPARQIYLFFSLLKKDKNEWLLQKCTELGVRTFVPILAERCERTVLSQNNAERWEKIVTEAAEQCGRSDIPHIRDPLSLETALTDYKDKAALAVADETLSKNKDQLSAAEGAVGVFIGPEGGWTSEELELFTQAGVNHLSLGNLTLRAETAAIAACARLAF